MYDVKANTLKNRLYITVKGTIGRSEVEDYKLAVKKNVAVLKSSFTALMDLRKSAVFDQESMAQLQGTKEIAVAAGLTRSAMVVESAIVKMQMNRNFKDVGPQDKAFTDLDEAEKFLND
ncbi:MAG: hypothetical protein ACYDG2_23760 [Ruminiclostridium sp.]